MKRYKSLFEKNLKENSWKQGPATVVTADDEPNPTLFVIEAFDSYAGDSEIVGKKVHKSVKDAAKELEEIRQYQIQEWEKELYPGAWGRMNDKEFYKRFSIYGSGEKLKNYLEDEVSIARRHDYPIA